MNNQARTFDKLKRPLKYDYEFFLYTYMYIHTCIYGTDTDHFTLLCCGIRGVVTLHEQFMHVRTCHTSISGISTEAVASLVTCVYATAKMLADIYGWIWIYISAKFC